MISGYYNDIMNFDYLIYGAHRFFGIRPKWERNLIQRDYQLRTYLKWKRSKKCSNIKCDELYYNRLSYLKGWLK